MDAVRRRHVVRMQVLRRLDVRGDHAFLDQLVRVVTLQHAGLHDLALRAKHETHFAGLELDRAAALARLGEDLEELVQALDVGQQRADPAQRILARVVRDALADRVPDLGVGQARVRVHHRLVELRVGDLAVAVDLHVADEAQPVDLGIERADAVGQGLRQHRHDEAGEIDRRRPFRGLLVERRPGTHVMRDVGDRHDQAEAVAVGLAIHRVVEVLGVLAVDGDQRQLAQVDALRRGRCIDGQRHRRGFVEHGLRELVRDIVSVDRRLHRQRSGQAVAQHRQHAPDRRTLRIGRLHQFAHHQLTVARIHVRVRRNQHVALDAPVVGHDITDARPR